MTRYSNKVYLVWENELSQFRITKAFFVRWREHTVEVESRFLTDLASIPRVFRSLIPQIGHHLQPAVAHDWVYQHHGGLTRLEADDMLMDGMVTVGVSWWRRHAMYRFVRVGGSGYWNEGNGEDSD